MMMRAAVIESPRRARVVHVPVPKPGAGQVRVRLDGCGICGSNAPLWEGRSWFQYPLAPGQGGHEGWGVVDALGDGVRGIEPGMRVAGLFGNAFAEYDLCAADSLVRVPRGLEGAPFPAEALGCGFNVVRRAEIGRGQTVAVVGVGFLGAVVTALAAQAGARVVAIARRPFAQSTAAALGAAETIPMDRNDRVIERVREATGGKLCPVVIEVTGAQAPLDLASAITATRGRLVIAGYHQDGPRHVDLQLWNWRGIDVVNAHERDPAAYVRGMREAAQAAARHRIDVRALCTHSFPLEEIGRGFDMLLERPRGFLKAVITA